MIDLTKKQSTLKTALANAVILCSQKTEDTIRNNSLPKGNLFDVARAAGLLAAKRTPELIPHCHPLPIDNLDIYFDHISVDTPECKHLFEIDPNKKGILVTASGKSIGFSEIEMEVLTAASISSLTIYDLLKPIDKELEIKSIKLLERKQDTYQFNVNKACILVCSDSTAKGTRKDKSGTIIKKMLSQYDIEVLDYQIVPDEPNIIQKQIKEWVKGNVPLIFTTGGTGLSPRDNTVSAVKQLIEKEAPGITESIRQYGIKRTPWAMLSCSIAGIISKSLVITLPGSSNGARESLEAILPGVFYISKMFKGEGQKQN